MPFFSYMVLRGVVGFFVVAYNAHLLLLNNLARHLTRVLGILMHTNL